MNAASRIKAELPIVQYLENRGHVFKKLGGEQFTNCPLHADKNPSFRVNIEKGAWYCDPCGIGGGIIELMVSVEGKSKEEIFQEYEHKHGQNGSHKVQFDGITLDEFAIAKKLEVDFLKAEGISQFKRDGKPLMRFPYRDPAGQERAARLRINLTGKNKHRWRKDDKPILYGLQRLKSGDHIVIVEGESDCLTCWMHDFPAIGLPGATNWKESRDADHFKDIPKIFVCIEPDAGGEAVKAWLAKSAIRDRAHLIQFGDEGDVSGLYLSDPENFPTNFQATMDAAVPWVQIEEEQRQQRHAETWEQCKGIATAPDILLKMVETVERLGVIGEGRLIQILYLAVTSRLLQKLISVAIKGVSSSGKSFIMEKTLQLFPESAFYVLTAMSEHALAYSEAPLKHRHLVIYEAAGMESEFQTYLIRSLLSEGCVRYETVEKTGDGLKARLIVREGPTGLLVTTTATNLHAENETRLLSITVKDTKEQTAAILVRMAEDEPAESPDVTPWQAFQEWLALGPADVVIPYALQLAQAIPPVAVRLRRDFAQILSLIGAHTLIHQKNRERDQQGRVIASLEDYVAVRDLVSDIVSAGLGATVPDSVRETVNAVTSLAPDFEEGVPVLELAKKLDLDRSSASRRFHSARDRGFLQNLETRRGRHARIAIDSSMPDDAEIFPPIEKLAADYTAPSRAHQLKDEELSANPPIPGDVQVCNRTGGDSPTPPLASDQDELMEEFIV